MYRWTLKFVSGSLEGIVGDFFYSFPSARIGEVVKGLLGTSDYIVLACVKEESK